MERIQEIKWQDLRELYRRFFQYRGSWFIWKGIGYNGLGGWGGGIYTTKTTANEEPNPCPHIPIISPLLQAQTPTELETNPLRSHL